MLLIFALFYAGSNPETMRSLREFLSFYRENRELIAMFLQNNDPTSSNATSSPPKEDEKNRPREEVGKHDVLGQYLSRLG